MLSTRECRTTVVKTRWPPASTRPANPRVPRRTARHRPRSDSSRPRARHDSGRPERESAPLLCPPMSAYAPLRGDSLRGGGCGRVRLSGRVRHHPSFGAATAQSKNGSAAQTGDTSDETTCTALWLSASQISPENGASARLIWTTLRAMRSPRSRAPEEPKPLRSLPPGVVSDTWSPTGRRFACTFS